MESEIYESIEVSHLTVFVLPQKSSLESWPNGIDLLSGIYFFCWHPHQLHWSL